jgi:hypothetical protein
MMRSRDDILRHKNRDIAAGSRKRGFSGESNKDPCRRKGEKEMMM